MKSFKIKAAKQKGKRIRIVNFDLNHIELLLNIKLFIGDFCKIRRISRLSGDRELTFEIGSLPEISGAGFRLEHMIIKIFDGLKSVVYVMTMYYIHIFEFKDHLGILCYVFKTTYIDNGYGVSKLNKTNSSSTATND